jgi:hypothetical protein
MLKNTLKNGVILLKKEKFFKNNKLNQKPNIL